MLAAVTDLIRLRRHPAKHPSGRRECGRCSPAVLQQAEQAAGVGGDDEVGEVVAADGHAEVIGEAADHGPDQIRAEQRGGIRGLAEAGGKDQVGAQA